MDFNIVKIGGFIVLILLYMMIRKLFSKFADFTEDIGIAAHNEEKIETLQAKIDALEDKINTKK